MNRRGNWRLLQAATVRRREAKAHANLVAAADANTWEGCGRFGGYASAPEAIGRNPELFHSVEDEAQNKSKRKRRAPIRQDVEDPDVVVREKCSADRSSRSAA